LKGSPNVGTRAPIESKRAKEGDTLESLSDGYQSVIALASDILEVMLRYYDEVKDSEGIVLIDEINVHLHPRWKVEIVNLLRDVFPRVQFLVTTHDPLCLMGSRPGEVHVLHTNPETKQVQAQQVDWWLAYDWSNYRKSLYF
jgi:predicted ATP-binding protein involved in virulence